MQPVQDASPSMTGRKGEIGSAAGFGRMVYRKLKATEGGRDTYAWSKDILLHLRKRVGEGKKKTPAENLCWCTVF